MPFLSLTFALFFPAVAFAVWAAPGKARGIVLAASSLCFAAWAGLPSVIVTAAMVIGTWVAVLGLAAADTPSARRRRLGIALLLALGPLVGLKYVLPGAEAGRLVPLGLSFFSLKLVAYAADVHRGIARPERNLLRLLAYTALWIELPAGPVDRPALLEQLRAVPGFDADRVAMGLRRMAWGLFKKTVVADRVAEMVDRVYASPEQCTGISLLVATALFGFQLYSDFSGYTDLAVGAGEVLGLKLAENFRSPFRAGSVSEFWTRWHISFSSWLRDYLFLPLSQVVGRRVGSSRPLGLGRAHWSYFVGVIATMLVAGVWHGSGAGFAVWGLLMGAFMALSVATRGLRTATVLAVRLDRFPRLHTALRTAVTFVLVTFTWSFFRAATLRDGAFVAGHLLDGVAGSAAAALAALARGDVRGFSDVLLPGAGHRDLILALIGIALVETVDGIGEAARFREKLRDRPTWVRWAADYAVVLAVVFYGVFGRRTFIYAGF